MEETARKKKKHWIGRIFCALLLLALIAVLLLAIRILPMALRLQRALASQNCGINAEVSLNSRALTADQQKLLRSLSLLTGLEESEWEDLELRGGYDRGTVRLGVYGGQDVLLTRLYLTKDYQAIDIRTIYDMTCAHLTEKLSLLSQVLPQWEIGDYVALQQLEYAFGVKLGELPDYQESLEGIQSGLELPVLCGAVLAADRWDRGAKELVYHIAAGDRRLELARKLMERAGHDGLARLLRFPEGMELDVAIRPEGSGIHMRITGKLPGAKQLADWSVELDWGGYVPEGGDISLVDQQVINTLAELLKWLEGLYS